MPCSNCSDLYPGKMVRIDMEHPDLCVECGKPLPTAIPHSTNTTWDEYFRIICGAVAFKSPCLSRQIGAILVRDKSIVSTGYNGPARGFPHCDMGADGPTQCPRRLQGFKSGEGLEHCPASHAEANAVANAARIGASTVGTTLYMNSVIPCKFCAVILVNAGIREIVVEDTTPYHEMSLDVFRHANVPIRSFTK